jgi:hypothetical protein
MPFVFKIQNGSYENMLFFFPRVSSYSLGLVMCFRLCTMLLHQMHLFMVQVDYMLFGTGWCMVDALVYGIGRLQVEVQVDAWFIFIGTILK